MYAEADGSHNTLLDIRKGQPILKPETEDSRDEHTILCTYKKESHPTPHTLLCTLLSYGSCGDNTFYNLRKVSFGSLSEVFQYLLGSNTVARDGAEYHGREHGAAETPPSGQPGRADTERSLDITAWGTD